MALAAGASAPDQTTSTEVCQVGRVALRDLPALTSTTAMPAITLVPIATERTCWTFALHFDRKCQKDIHFSNNEARTRASAHVPVPGQSNPPATEIFSINPPRVFSDGKTALVTMRMNALDFAGGILSFAMSEPRRGGAKRSHNHCSVLRTLDPARPCLPPRDRLPACPLSHFVEACHPDIAPMSRKPRDKLEMRLI